MHARDDYGCTALHSATSEVMQLLVVNGARLNVQDSVSRKHLMMASDEELILSEMQASNGPCVPHGGGMLLNPRP